MGTKFKYISANYCAAATITIGGNWGEDANYPKANCFNNRVSKRMGFDTDEDGTIVLDLSSAASLDTLALMNHNLTSGATVTLQMNNSDSWGSPPVNEVLTYREGDMHIQLDSPVSYRYVRVVVDDTGRGSTDIKIGELILGLCTELDRNFDWNLKHKKEYKKIKHITVGGNIWTNSLYNQNIFTMSFSAIDSTQIAEIWEMIDSAEGGAIPFLVIIELVPYFIRLPDKIDVDRPILQTDLESLGQTFFPVDYRVSSLALTEESRGI